MIHLNIAVNPHHHCDVGFFVDLVLRRPDSVFKHCQRRVRDFLIFRSLLQRGFLSIRIVRQHGHKGCHFLFFLLADDFVDLLQQLRSILVHLTHKNAHNRTGTVLTSVAEFLSGKWPGNVRDIERIRIRINLQT